MARILLLLPGLPHPPRSGAALRNWGIIRALAAAGHQLHLLCAEEGPISPELAAIAQEIRRVAIPPRTLWQRTLAAVQGKVDLVERLSHTAMADGLRAMLKANTYDAAQLEGLEMTACLPLLRQALPRLLYDAHNAEAALQASAAALTDAPLKRQYSRLQARRLARYEAELCATVDEVIAVSDEDAAALNRLAPAANIRVIPNSIRVSDYAGERAETAPPTLAFSGKMDYRPNVDAMLWFSQEIWPRIRQQEKEARLLILGRSPAGPIQALHGENGIRVTGALPGMLPHLLSCSLYVAPLRLGSGTRLKLLEAMAAGCAIVATPLAAAGLRGAGEAFCLAEGAEDFAARCLELLAEGERRQQLGERARELVVAHYDEAQTAPLWQALYA